MIFSDSVPARDEAVATLASLCGGLIGESSANLGATQVDAAALPPWAALLLVHEEHMTRRLQMVYAEPVALAVVREITGQDSYRRLVHLSLPSSGAVVEVGVCRIDFRYTSPEVRDEVLRKEKPLGDILIRHDVMRRIEPKWYWKFARPSPILAGFGGECEEACGRFGVIRCNGLPAIEVLEVVNHH